MIGLADETGAKVAGLTSDNYGSPSLILTDRRGEEHVRLLGPVPVGRWQYHRNLGEAGQNYALSGALTRKGNP
jgi:hypothetical protein